MRKGDETEGSQIRLMAEDTPDMVSRVDELIVMDQVAFVYRNQKEYVFRQGNFFSDSMVDTKNTEKEYDEAYSLVSPTSLAPMVMFLSKKK